MTPASAKPCCRNCTRPFTRPPQAQNKEFCSSACRTDWHNERRRLAADALRRQEEAERLALGTYGEDPNA